MCDNKLGRRWLLLLLVKLVWPKDVWDDEKLEVECPCCPRRTEGPGSLCVMLRKVSRMKLPRFLGGSCFVGDDDVWPGLWGVVVIAVPCDCANMVLKYFISSSRPSSS